MLSMPAARTCSRAVVTPLPRSVSAGSEPVSMAFFFASKVASESSKVALAARSVDCAALTSGLSP